MTTYDEIWSCFIDICNIDRELLPQTDEGKYILINSSARNYNTFIDKSEIKIKCDNLTEQINISLDDNRILILAYCMRYTFQENALQDFISIWGGFVGSDVGVKDYRAQVTSRESTMDRSKSEILRLLGNIDEMSYLEE